MNKVDNDITQGNEMLRSIFHFGTAISLLITILLALYELGIGFIGFLFADKNYLSNFSCSHDITCTLSKVYYSSDPFLIGLLGMMVSMCIMYIAIKVDEKI